MLRNTLTFRRLFDFKGRASRREFLLVHAAWILSWILPILAVAIIAGGGDPNTLTGVSSVFAMVLATISGIIMVVGFVPLWAVAFRRLHDQGNSAAFILLCLIPVIGWIFFLIMMFYPGQRYDNQYGPDPREPVPSGDDNLETVFS